MEAAIMRKTVYDFANALPNRTTEIYQEERLQVASMLNIVDELDPVELATRKSVRTGTCTPINILYAARDFYALEALSAMLFDANSNHFDPARHSHVFWFDAFTEFRNLYASKLATAIFDYTVSVAAGEMRHAKTEASFYCKDFPYTDGSGRFDVYVGLDEFEPYSVLAAASRVFSDDIDWERGFGGRKWKQIADAGLKRKTLSDVAFIDHCVDLSHNNSVYFDKGASIFELAYAEEYRNFLDLKRKAAPEELFYEIGKPIASFVRRANALGIMDVTCCERPGRNTDRVLCYIPIRWGKTYVSSALGAGKFVAKKRSRDHRPEEAQVFEKSTLRISDFQVGEKVVCLNPYNNATLKPNISTGIVKYIESSHIAVQWDTVLINGHGCQGHVDDGYGWWVPPYMVKKFAAPEEIKIGDMVQLTGEDDCVPKGAFGKVLDIQGSILSVEWSNYVTSPATGEIVGYCVTPECKRGHGWKVCATNVIKAHEVRILKKTKVPAYLQEIPPCDFAVGDAVVISNTGPMYSSYSQWVRAYAPQYSPDFKANKEYKIGTPGTIVAMGQHLSWKERKPLCLVKTASGVCVIGAKGLTKKEKYVA